MAAMRKGVADSTRYERLFVKELATIQGAVDTVRRRHRLSAIEAEDLLSEAYVKIVEDDYAVLRKFLGQSSLKTYLTVVVNRVHLDARDKLWGRWRPSVAARRHGRIAIDFERLTRRQGLAFDDACAAVERRHGTASVDRPALLHLDEILPRRLRRHFTAADVLEEIAAPEADPDSKATKRARAVAWARTSRAVAAEVARLPRADRQLVRRRFVDGTRVMDLARESAEPPKALYRHVSRLLSTLRHGLEQRGVSRPDAVELLRAPYEAGTMSVTRL